MNRFLSSAAVLSTVSVLGLSATAMAAPVIDGVIDGSYGAPVKSYTGSYINGNDASAGTNDVDTYFQFDANFVYGAVKLVGGGAAFPGANIYMYSSGANTNNITNLPGVYGSGDDIIAEGANGWGFGGPSGMAGAPVAYNPATVDYFYDPSTMIAEFSISRTLLGDYDSFRYGGQFFGYEFHTGSGDRQPGALVAVPEPTSLAVLTLAGAGLMARRRNRA